jgi:chromosomal replication initiator protein
MDKELNELWQIVLSELKDQVSQGTFTMVLKPTMLISLEDDIATIGVSSNMILGLLQKRFTESIKAILDQKTEKDLSILFIQKNIPHVKDPQAEEKMGPLFTPEENIVKPVIGHLPRVRPDFTFSNFAVSSSNQLAFVSASTVASNIGQSYNPFFLYGPVGVGKTHLMHAIANQTYSQRPDGKIIYITSEEFTNEVVEAIRTNATANMKRRFRSAVLLLIDDIQFIEGKERVQEELFHTFNILIDNGAQIVLSSDRPPHEIKKLEKRLSSRFAGGLTVDIEPPDFELKTAILLIKAKKFGYELPIEVAKTLAENAEDTRSLEGLLLRVITQATAANSPITPEIAEKAMGNMVVERRERLHPDDVINYVCSFYQIKTTQLKGPKRDASLVRARQVCMYLLKTQLNLTLVEIGNLLGGRDHTTIIHGVDKIENLVENKDKISEDILGITKSFRG